MNLLPSYFTLIRGAFAVILSTIFFLVSCFPSQGVPSNENTSESFVQTWLLFERRTGFIKTLYAMDAMTPEHMQKLFETSPKVVERYFISPNGQFVVLRSDGQLRVIDTYTGEEVVHLDAGPQLLTEFHKVKIDNEVAWAPDSNKFVFVYKSSESQIDLMLYDLNSQQLSQVTADSSFKNAPSWSLDGQQLAFAEIMICNESQLDCVADQNHWNISVININNFDRYIVADMSKTIIPQVDWTANSICQLNWSPDGKYILFKRFCPEEGVPVYDDLFVLEVDALSVNQLTDFGDIDYAHNYAAGWTSDSNYLIVAFSRNYIFDDLSNEYGFLMFDTNSFAEELNIIKIDGLNPNYISWSPQKEYVIAPIGPEHSFLGRLQDDQLTVITDMIPRVSSAGYWTTDGYVTQWQNKLVKIIVPSGEINDLGIELEDGMTLIGWRQVDIR